jgi:putative YphP/YqiW family bacilliredoxin
MYPAELVKPMREDLTNVGFEELHTPEAVDAALAKEGTTLVVVNSVCGCAAANARPGARMSLQNTKKPDHIVTVLQVLIKKRLTLLVVI